MELNFNKDESGLLFLRPAGRLDMNEGDLKWEQMTNHCDEHADLDKGAIIDFKDVHFISSGVFSWLLIQHNRFKAAGSRIVLTNISTKILQTMKVMRLDKIFTITQNEVEATELFKVA